MMKTYESDAIFAPEASDDWLTMRQVAELLPGRPHIGTVTRWTQKPIRGRILPSMLCGGKRFVKRSDLERFVQAFNSEHGAQQTNRYSENSVKHAAVVDALLNCPQKSKSSVK